MRLLDRFLRRELPAELPPLAAGERVVAWGTTKDGAAAVATNLALWLPARKTAQSDAVSADTAQEVPSEPVTGPATGGTGNGVVERPGWSRLAWSEIHKVAWAGDALAITPGVEVEPGVVADGRVRRLRLPEPRDLPVEVRTRVTRSVAHTSQHRLVSGGSVRVVARRVPGVDGLTWQLRFDDGADPANPGVRAEAEGILTEVRALSTP